MTASLPRASTAERRALSRQARDAFPPMGVYAIRDRVSGEVLVASSRNVPGAINRIRFELRLGTHGNKRLQAEWNRSGADRFAFEVLELVKERTDAGFDYAAELQGLEQIYREEFAQPGGPA